MDATDKVLKNYKKTIPRFRHISNGDIVLPNNSGDHMRSIRRQTPVADEDLANKKYVDDNDIALGETSSTAYRGDRGKTAYDHSQDNTQAHSDYLLNSGADEAAGPLTITADNSSADTAYVPMVLYNTDDAPPAANTVPVGTIYIQYTV